MRRLDDPEVGFIAGLQGEERARYYRWYQKYLLIRRASWFFGAVLVVLLIARIIAGSSGWIVVRLCALALLSGAGLMVWGGFLECPRCGQTFFTNGRYEPVDKCGSCGLTLRQLSSIAKPRT